MAIARRYFERHAIAVALGTQLNSLGLNVGQIREGFQSEEAIEAPMVAVHFLPSSYIEHQLGRKVDTEKSFSRRVQVDCYMETEPRADSIADVVGDFFDEFFINIKDANDVLLGNLYCSDSETITLDVVPPIFKEARAKRWRAVVQATLQADYF